MSYNVTASCSRYVSPQMTYSLLEFLVAQWLENPTSVWKVVGSIPIRNSQFFLSPLPPISFYHSIYLVLLLLSVIN